MKQLILITILLLTGCATAPQLRTLAQRNQTSTSSESEEAPKRTCTITIINEDGLPADLSGFTCMIQRSTNLLDWSDSFIATTNQFTIETTNKAEFFRFRLDN